MCPLLFKGSRSLLLLALRSVTYLMSCTYLLGRVLNRLAAVLYYVSRVRYCLSALVYAGVSLFIIVGPCVCLVVCVIYAYNLAWGGLKNGKNGGEPYGFCPVFVVRKSNFGILGKLKERSTFKFLFLFREIFFY